MNALKRAQRFVQERGIEEADFIRTEAGWKVWGFERGVGMRFFFPHH